MRAINAHTVDAIGANAHACAETCGHERGVVAAGLVSRARVRRHYVAVSMISTVSLGREDIKRGWVHTGAAIIDVDRAGAIDGRGKFTTLAIADVGVRFHGGVEGCARGVDVEMHSGCGGDDHEGAVQLPLQQQQRDW